MQSAASNEANEPLENDKNQAPCAEPSKPRGLKRMEGTSQLKPMISKSPVKRPQTNFLNHSESLMNMRFDLNSSTSQMPMGLSNVDNVYKPFVIPSMGLTRTKSTLPLKNMFPTSEKRGNPVKIHQESQPKITPIRFKVERTPGGTINKATIIPKIKSTAVLETIQDEEQVTPPPVLRRTSSGSMLLRQTPERVRRQEEDVVSPVKRMRRSGSMPRSVGREDLSAQESISDNKSTPILKRKRTSSLTSLFSDMPLLTPQRLRPRNLSESRMDDDFPTSSAIKMPSPTKKRNRTESGSRPPSPLKKRYISCNTLEPADNVSSTPVTTTPMRKFKSTIFNPKTITERIAQTYGSGIQWTNVVETPSTSVIDNNPPSLVTRSTSGDTYYSATEGEETIPLEAPELPTKVLPFIKSHETMVPLVKKQISIDDKILEDEEDEGFGDSMKTIKRGQGSQLARSVSLKLSPRFDVQKPLGTDTEKSCSTPSLPTAPLLRQSSASSFRFKVSPSTFLKPLNSKPFVVAPAAASIPASAPAPVSAPVVQPIQVEPIITEISEPSTSRAVDPEPEVNLIMKKSALKPNPGTFNVRDESLHGYRRRKIKFSGLNVHYFDRRQGESTVPTEGDVSLDMHDAHHSHRYFSLSSGKRPQLDLTLYEDDELSEDEVIEPDSDGEREYDEYASAKTIPRINQRHRIKLLKKSGVKVEKNAMAIDSLRSTRTVCGCSCENGVCLPETCECAIEGINCQVDGGEYPTHPCTCFAETCTNPEGRIFYDPEAVHDFRSRTIANWRAGQRSGIFGSPVVKKFADSDDEEDGSKSKNWLLKTAIPIKLEESPTKYPVTPVYTRRSRSSLSDIRESTSEGCCATVTPSPSLSERICHQLENEVCVEEEEEEMKELEVVQDETIVDTEITFQQVFVNQEAVEVDADADAEMLETAMSPVKTTLVV